MYSLAISISGHSEFLKNLSVKALNLNEIYNNYLISVEHKYLYISTYS